MARSPGALLARTPTLKYTRVLEVGVDAGAVSGFQLTGEAFPDPPARAFRFTVDLIDCGRGGQLAVQVPEVGEQAVVPGAGAVVEEHPGALGLPVDAALGLDDRPARSVPRHQRARSVAVDAATAVLEADQHHRFERQPRQCGAGVGQALAEALEAELVDDGVVQARRLRRPVAIATPIGAPHVPSRRLEDQPRAVSRDARVGGEGATVGITKAFAGRRAGVDLLRPCDGNGGGHDLGGEGAEGQLIGGDADDVARSAALGRRRDRGPQEIARAGGVPERDVRDGLGPGQRQLGVLFIAMAPAAAAAKVTAARLVWLDAFEVPAAPGSPVWNFACTPAGMVKLARPVAWSRSLLAR